MALEEEMNATRHVEFGASIKKILSRVMRAEIFEESINFDSLLP